MQGSEISWGELSQRARLLKLQLMRYSLLQSYTLFMVLFLSTFFSEYHSDAIFSFTGCVNSDASLKKVTFIALVYSCSSC